MPLGMLFDWQTRALLAVLIGSVIFFFFCYLLLGLAPLLALAAIVAAILAILTFSRGVVRGIAKITPMIEQTQRHVSLNDGIYRSEWRLYDLVNWEFLRQKQHIEENTLE